MAEERKQPKKKSNDEEHLATTRCELSAVALRCALLLIGSSVYQPNLKAKSDADILRDAKLEAMGLPPEEHEPRRNDRAQMATDELVCCAADVCFMYGC